MNRAMLVCLGIILSPHGITGAVKIKTFTENPKNIVLYGRLINGNESYNIHSVSVIGTNLIRARIDDVDSCNDAELLRNKKLYISKDKLPELDNKNEFYYDDLIGIEVRLMENQPYGYVEAIYNFGSGDILKISVSNGKKNLLLSFTKETFPHINIRERYIILNMPEFVD